MTIAFDKWLDNSIQFPRLLAELAACCELSPADFEALAETMDLEIVEIEELFNRAQTEWERIKDLLRADKEQRFTESVLILLENRTKLPDQSRDLIDIGLLAQSFRLMHRDERGDLVRGKP